MQRAVFLDRDGVLAGLVPREGRSGSPRNLDEFALVPEAAAAVRAVKEGGLLALVVTNQPEIARGFLQAEELERMHVRLQADVPVDAIYTCPHDDGAACDCRKPRPGLLFQAARELDVDLEQSFLVGDTWRDIGAGQAAGCWTILVRSPGYEGKHFGADRVVQTLQEAVTFILEKAAAPRDSRFGRLRARVVG